MPPKVPLKSKEAIAKAAASSSKGKKKKWSKGKSKEKVNNLVLFDKVSGGRERSTASDRPHSVLVCWIERTSAGENSRLTCHAPSIGQLLGHIR
mmetsp:Transcript_1043/g.6608  ORF Transcript_1043/g.6608 Transcript_1043/m.6608 type:complete len:94 (-) Transcript_1043:844-1125(-)